MSLRQWINRNSHYATTIAVAFVVIAIVVLVFTSRGSDVKFYGSAAYFTDNDGDSYFKGPIDTPVPYTKGDKEVVRAHVYRCKSKGTFVAFLQRYTPAAQEALREAAEAKKEGRPPKNANLVNNLDQLGSEWKKPGAGSKWVRGNSGDVVVGDAMQLCDNKPGEVAMLVAP